jgi:glyoxylase-like metal-dependent hydrolase (beta-lactamase superfamily II)
MLFTSDMIDNRVNYEKEIPMGPGLIWNRETWFESLRRIKDIERTTGAEIVFGHDLEQFERIRDGW